MRVAQRLRNRLDRGHRLAPQRLAGELHLELALDGDDQPHGVESAQPQFVEIGARRQTGRGNFILPAAVEFSMTPR